MCNHKTCLKFRNLGLKPGVAAVVFNWYNRVTPVALLGKETQHNGAYSLCAGKLDTQDNGCYLFALKRELREEFKIDLNWQQFDFHFRNNTGKLRYLIHNGTPVFIGIFSGLSRTPLNNQILQDLNNPRLSRAFKEITHVDWFHLDGTQIENQPVQVTRFALAVLRNIDINRL